MKGVHLKQMQPSTAKKHNAVFASLFRLVGILRKTAGNLGALHWKRSTGGALLICPLEGLLPWVNPSRNIVLLLSSASHPRCF